MHDRLIHDSKNTPLKASIGLFLMDCKARGLSPKTTTFYRNYLDQLPDTITDVHQFDHHAVMSLFADMRDRGMSGINIHGAYRTYKAFGNWLYAQELTDTPQLAKLRPPRFDRVQHRPPTSDTVQALLSTVDAKNEACLRDRAVILFMLDTGCRVGELEGLRREAAGGTVMLTGCKGRKDRYAFLSSQTMIAIQRYHNVRSDSSPALFMGGRHKPLTRGAVISMLKRRTKEAGIHLSAHDLRRAAATAWVENGANLEIVRQLLGHSDLTVTQTYLGVNSDILKQVHEQVSYVGNMTRK